MSKVKDYSSLRECFWTMLLFLIIRFVFDYLYVYYISLYAYFHLLTVISISIAVIGIMMYGNDIFKLSKRYNFNSLLFYILMSFVIIVVDIYFILIYNDTDDYDVMNRVDWNYGKIAIVKWIEIATITVKSLISFLIMSSSYLSKDYRWRYVNGEREDHVVECQRKNNCENFAVFLKRNNYKTCIDFLRPVYNTVKTSFLLLGIFLFCIEINYLAFNNNIIIGFISLLFTGLPYLLIFGYYSTYCLFENKNSKRFEPLLNQFLNDRGLWSSVTQKDREAYEEVGLRFSVFSSKSNDKSKSCIYDIKYSYYMDHQDYKQLVKCPEDYEGDHLRLYHAIEFHGFIIGFRSSSDDNLVNHLLYRLGPFIFGKSKSINIFRIPEDVKVIGEKAFENCKNLSAIILPEDIQLIQKEAFLNCTSLKYLYIPRSIYEFEGEDIFRGCTQLKLKENAIYSDAGVKKLLHAPKNAVEFIVDEGTAIIGDEAFRNCDSLRNIFIPNSVDSMHYNSFDGCVEFDRRDEPIYNRDNTNLLYVPKNMIFFKIPISVNHIGYGAFTGCKSIKSVVLPPNIDAIDSYLFDGCSALQDVYIPEGVKKIGDFAFKNCTSLASIILPDSINEIESDAFCGCTALTTLTIPKGVSKFNLEIVEGCSSLRSIKFNNPISFFNFSCTEYLKNCDSLTHIYIPKSKKHEFAKTFLFFLKEYIVETED